MVPFLFLQRVNESHEYSVNETYPCLRMSNLKRNSTNTNSEIRATLIGVYNADGGILGELSYVLGHLIGVTSCSLCDISHSPLKKKASFKALERELLQQHGIAFKMIHRNERNARETKASEGREPCVLLEHNDESISMFLDSAELKTLGGKVASFEKLIYSRLDLFQLLEK